MLLYSSHGYIFFNDFCYLVFHECIFVSFPVVLFITGEAPSAAFPAHTRWAPFPVQAFLHREHCWRRPQKSHTYATTLTQSQVREA